jgi:hypothetical protein
MRLGLIVLFVALLLAIVAGQNSLLQSTDAQTEDSAITTCAVEGGSCETPSLSTSSTATVLEHTVLSGGCFEADLHVVRYVPADAADGPPLVATWCS